MTNREQEIRAMKGPQLIAEADRLGIKINCNKARTQLSEAKSKVIERILAFEAEQIEVIPPNTLVETPAPENPVAVVVEEVTPPTPKRGALIEWNGKSQNICAWAKELGVSANTLYGRIYKLGWSVEKAFTRKGRK